MRWNVNAPVVVVGPGVHHGDGVREEALAGLDVLVVQVGVLAVDEPAGPRGGVDSDGHDAHPRSGCATAPGGRCRPTARCRPCDGRRPPRRRRAGRTPGCTRCRPTSRRRRAGADAGEQQPGAPAGADEHGPGRLAAVDGRGQLFPPVVAVARRGRRTPRRPRTSGRCRAGRCGSGRTPARRGRTAGRRWCRAGWTGTSAGRYGRAAGSRGCRRPRPRCARRTRRCR